MPRLVSRLLLGLLTVGVAATPFATSGETSLTELRHETRELLTQEAGLDEQSLKHESAVTALCDLYVILRSDPRFATSSMLQGDAAKVRRRLIRIATRREYRLGRAGIEKPATLSQQVDRAIEESLTAQRENSAVAVVPEKPVANGLAGAPLGGNPWQLVELIQRVIDPDLWDVQGGAGTIQYFAMRRVLVVRATSDTHEKIRELLTALR
jgi:hypothetical protein